MATKGNRSLGILDSKVRWAHSMQEATRVLLSFTAHGVPLGFAILDPAKPAADFSHSQGTTSISVRVELNCGKPNLWSLSYAGSINSDAPNSTKFSGILAEFEPGIPYS